MGYIAVDLDGTLAFYDHWRGPEHIGDPIPAMVERVKAWLQEGREVRIFTARAATLEQIPPVIDWCCKHIGVVLKVTNVKDMYMDVLWDDRCVRVIQNTGERCCG